MLIFAKKYADLIGWIAFATGLLGAILNAAGVEYRSLMFTAWAVSNVSWIIQSYLQKNTPLMLQSLAFSGTTAWGIFTL
jgi:hypothetical protein